MEIERLARELADAQRRVERTTGHKWRRARSDAEFAAAYDELMAAERALAAARARARWLRHLRRRELPLAGGADRDQSRARVLRPAVVAGQAALPTRLPRRDRRGNRA